MPGTCVTAVDSAFKVTCVEPVKVIEEPVKDIAPVDTRLKVVPALKDRAFVAVKAALNIVAVVAPRVKEATPPTIFKAVVPVRASVPALEIAAEVALDKLKVVALVIAISLEVNVIWSISAANVPAFKVYVPDTVVSSVVNV